MKKILAVLLTLILVFAFCAMPASAETKASEWKKGSGPATIDFSDEGTKVIFEEGISLYYYQNKVNLRDFTVKIKVNAPKIHDEWGFFCMTLGGNGSYMDTASQNFVLFYPVASGIEIQPQVLHNGIGGIEPKTRTVGVDLNEDITISFKKVTDELYSVKINDATTFEYSIPENFNWVEDVNGEGCIAFGGRVGQVYAENNGVNVGDYNVLVKEINGVKMNGKNETTNSGSNNTTGGSNNTTGGSNVDPETGIDTGIIGGGDTTDDTTTDVTTEGENNQGFIILLVSIIVGGVILALALVLVIILVLKKKSTATEEEIAEDSEETTEE